MPQSMSERLDEIFHRASMLYVRKALKSERDRAELEAINQRSVQKQEDLAQLYRKEYEARVDAARQRLHDKAAQSRLEHPAPLGGGGDKASDKASAINLEAHRQVQLAHEADLQRTRDEAQSAFEDLLNRAQRRNQMQDVAANAFRRAGDRRSGQDRRIPKQSLD